MAVEHPRLVEARGGDRGRAGRGGEEDEGGREQADGAQVGVADVDHGVCERGVSVEGKIASLREFVKWDLETDFLDLHTTLTLLLRQYPHILEP